MCPMKSQPDAEPVSPLDADARKRVTKACDRCRLKKIKCDGLLPCTRCQTDSSICQFVERKKNADRRIPPGYVEYLEDSQQLLVKALKKSWANGPPRSCPDNQSSADPTVHAILQDLGVLSESSSRKSGGDDLALEEDLELVRHKLEGASDLPSPAHSLSFSHPRSQVSSDVTSPTVDTPTLDKPERSQPFSEGDPMPAQYGQLPDASKSTPIQPNNWFDAPPLPHAATYPAQFPHQPSNDWQFRQNLQLDNQPDGIRSFGGEDYGSGFRGFGESNTNDFGRQQPYDRQMGQRKQSHPQHRLSGLGMANQQAPSSTVSPTQLSLPASLQPFDPPKEDMWAHLMNQRRESSIFDADISAAAG